MEGRCIFGDPAARWEFLRQFACGKNVGEVRVGKYIPPVKSICIDFQVEGGILSRSCHSTAHWFLIIPPPWFEATADAVMDRYSYGLAPLFPLACREGQ